MKRPCLSSALVAAVLITAGCDPGRERGRSADAETALASIDRSGVTGSVRAEHSADGVTVTLRLTGLQAGEEYPAHIHDGRCAAGGPVEVPLGRLTGAADGMASLTTRVGPGQLSADRAAFIQVHDAAGVPVACADLPGHEGGDALTERLDADSLDADTAGG